MLASLDLLRSAFRAINLGASYGVLLGSPAADAIRESRLCGSLRVDDPNWQGLEGKLAEFGQHFWEHMREWRCDATISHPSESRYDLVLNVHPALAGHRYVAIAKKAFPGATFIATIDPRERPLHRYALVG